jgi:hypothetical protein
VPERGADPWCCSPTSDGRAKDLRLTARGWALPADVEEIYRELEAGWAATLGVDGVESLRRDLEGWSGRSTTGPSRRCFFLTATEDIERGVAEEAEPRRRIRTYLTGVDTAMRLHSPAFYDDMVNYEPTARIYRKNSGAAARRVHEMIDDGIRAGALRDVNGTFAAQVVALTVDVEAPAPTTVLPRSAPIAAHDTAVCAPLGDGEDNGEERGDRRGEDELRPAGPEEGKLVRAPGGLRSDRRHQQSDAQHRPRPVWA